MTTDPFTTAARAEAEDAATIAHTPIRLASGRAIDSDEHIAYRRGFVAGSEWARSYLAAQEPTDAEVIAALGAANRVTLTGSRFDAPLDFYADSTVKVMRAALSAARRAQREDPTR